MSQTSTTPPALKRPASFSSSPGLLALEGGTVLRGRLRGAQVPAQGDLIFTTAATGWGEILTDPSYEGQVVVLTHPMAGSYRIDPSELESDRVHARALLVTRLVTPPAGPGLSLEEILVDAGVPALEGIDTRALTLELRRGAARRGVVRPGEAGDAGLLAVADALATPPWESVDHVAAVSCADAFEVPAIGEQRGYAVLVDYGVKRSLLRALSSRGVHISVLPYDATAAEVLSRRPDLIVLSPGPGDPARMLRQIAAVGGLAASALAGGPPVLGICLGHQLLALAAGAPTRRLAVGHHGGNHAVMEVESGRVDIGAHNHEVAVLDAPELAFAGYRVSHRDLNDGTVEGLTHMSGRIASVQFHPEGAPGPIDAARVFDLAVAAATAPPA
ncbi:MAG TPA: glutamine-hydrolyzing carbamoyl-phosphate synthase small subunit [Candidatus Limnocylindrales bacterium]|nr:glutamine-hydrolyzing carbamoyl-phosphate synthase small subunit [Candidatus Limnocylindrales bacterium]